MMIQLTQKEELIMAAIWKIASPFSIRDISSPFPYTTVASIVGKLQKKGYISNTLRLRDRGKYLYHVIIPKEDYIFNELNNLFVDFCDSNPSTFTELVTQVISGTDKE